MLPRAETALTGDRLAWLDQRDYDDLDGQAERALRAAGVAFQDDNQAEANLAAARAVAPTHRAAPDAKTRFWLFALQAHGYVLLRLGRRQEAFEAFRKIIELDRSDQTKTRVLLEVLEKGEDQDV